jgi:UDP-glucose 4-epimerase
MSTYLVTGIAGFIGSSLARAILAQGDRVRGIDNFSTGKQSNIAELLDRADIREADLLDLEAVQSACTGVDFVLHEAAIPSVPRSVLNPPTLGASVSLGSSGSRGRPTCCQNNANHCRRIYAN